MSRWDENGRRRDEHGRLVCLVPDAPPRQRFGVPEDGDLVHVDAVRLEGMTWVAYGWRRSDRTRVRFIAGDGVEPWTSGYVPADAILEGDRLDARAIFEGL